MGFFFEMMINYHPHKEKNHNLKIMVLEIFRNSKYNFRISKFQKSFAKCKWVIMYITYEQSFGL